MSLIEVGKVSAMEIHNDVCRMNGGGECISSTVFRILWQVATSPVPTPKGSCQLGVSPGVKSVENCKASVSWNMLSCVSVLCNLVRNLCCSFSQLEVAHFAILVREMPLTEISCLKTGWCQHLIIKMFLTAKLSCSFWECSSLLLGPLNAGL